MSRWQYSKASHDQEDPDKGIDITSDLAIYRVANELIKQHGLKGASDYAADRVKTLMDAQFYDGVAVWRKISAALVNVSDFRFEDDPVN